MNRFVLDCSVAVAWCFGDELNDYTKSVLRELETAEAVVPAIWPLEVVNVLVQSERKGRLTAGRTAQFLTFLEDLPIRVDEQSTRRVFSDILHLARTERLTAYDSAYLELAARRGLALATLDKGLKRAAARLGVVLFKD